MTKKIIIYIAGLFLFLWFLGMIVFVWKINHFQTAPAQKTDAIIALTGGRNRISEALNLLQTGMADRLFISGVGKDISLENIGKTQHLNLSQNRKVNIGHQASNTVENAIEASNWIKKNNIHSIRLVTSPYHIARSLLEFREYNPDIQIVLHPVYSENIEKKWWTSWRTFSLLFKEYNKFLYVCCKKTIKFWRYL